MSSNPREPTTEGYDSYESAQQARSYVDDILEQDAKLRSASDATARGRKRGSIALALAVPVFIALTVMNFAAANRAAAPLSPDDARREAQVGIYLAIQQVEAYKAANGGRLPGDLYQVGADGPGLVFTPDERGYEIVAQIDGSTERYRSGEDPARFEEAARSLFVVEEDE